MRLRVLVACECSGRVRDAFAARGWEAWSADLLPSETPVKLQITGTPTDGYETAWDLKALGRHYQGDCRDLFDSHHPVNFERTQYWCEEYADSWRLWDLIIAHPPCDHLSYAGARWFKVKQADGRQEAALEFFGEMMNAPSPLVAVENPHSIAQVRFGKPGQVVQPWMFGDPFIKAIHLWLKGLPPLAPTHTEKQFPGLFRVTTGGGSWRTDLAHNRARMSLYEDSEGRKNRARVRSRTHYGLAQAMAAQWGSFAEEFYR